MQEFSLQDAQLGLGQTHESLETQIIACATYLTPQPNG